MSLLCMLKRSLWLYPPYTLWNALPIVKLASVPIREVWRLGRVRSCTHQSRLSQWSIRDGLGPRRLVNVYGRASLHTVPCTIAGILALSCWKRKIVSNSLIDWQDMFVKAFIYIALACK